MASPTVLIVGRGPAAYLAARLAVVRGYVPTLAVRSGFSGPSLYLGGREGISALVEAESSFPFGMGEASSDPSLSLLLYLGSPHRRVGCRLSGPVSPEEMERFFPGREILQTAFSPELDGRILLSYRKTSVRAPLGERIVNWFLEPERQKESLSRALRKQVPKVLPPWSPLLEDILPFAGFGSRTPDSAESLRLLTQLTESRGVVLTGIGVSPELPGVETHLSTSEPVLLKKAKRGRGFVLSGEDRSFDRVLALTGTPDFPLTTACCDVDPERLSPLWPSCLLLRDSPGRVSLLLRDAGQTGSGMRARLVVPGTRGNPEEEMREWVDRWNRESLFPFLRPGSLEMAEEGPMLAFASGHSPSLREVTPLLSVAGHLAEMVDPALLPVIPEDFWADLSLALPSLRPSRGA
ncbi:MAG: hypothetical protein M1313_02775 [Nitrospirae bacterium]|nr:hypothetical protein [Nitrospirota bacterium]